jgi:hypothetical protein
MSQLVEHLPSKHEALKVQRSPSTTHTKKKAPKVEEHHMYLFLSTLGSTTVGINYDSQFLFFISEHPQCQMIL